MKLLAGALILFAFLAVARSETCAETTSCMNHAAGIQDASSRGDVAAICRMQQKMADCIDSAMADCQAKGTQLPEQAVTTLKKAVADIRKQYEQMCKGYGTGDGSSDKGVTYGSSSGGKIPETATCMEITSCVFDMNEVNKAINAGELQKACAIVKPSTKCLKSAYADCSEKNILPKDQLDNLRSQVDQADKMLTQRCGKDGSGMGTSSESGSSDDNNGALGTHVTDLSMLLFTAFFFIAARFF